VHFQFIRERTEANRKLSDVQLTIELVQVFPDLGSVGAEAVRQARIQLDLHFLPMRPECHMSDVNRRCRVKWCEEQEHRDWRNVVFTDESWFEVGVRRRWVWRHHDDYGPDVCYSTEAHPKKIMIWGAVGYNFKSSLHFVTDGTVTGAYYFDQVISGIFLHEANRRYGEGNWILQQDNARPHIKKDVVEAMERIGIHILKPWPPYSPDLNIIERVWAIMKHRIERNGPSTLEQLKEAIVDVWETLTLETINSLIAEMPRRMRQVRFNAGRSIQRLTVN
jgi:transposase